MKKGSLFLKKILNAQGNNHEQFHELTSITRSNNHRIIPQKVFFKAYDRFPAIKLGRKTLATSFKKTITERSSNRDLRSSDVISSREIGSLLYYSAGMKKYKSPLESYRFYPSAGGRFPLEVYLIANRVEGLTQGGIYHYNVKGDFLEERLPTKNESLNGCFQQPFVQKSKAILVISGVFKRTTMKYGERGYRYVLMESGHLGQNIYLVGTALNLNVCGICGFYDSKINSYLHIDGVTESVLYCFSLNS